MKRVGALFVRAFVVALLLLSLAGNVASADTGRRGPSAQTIVLPDDPGFPSGGVPRAFLPDDPGYSH